MWQMSSRIRRDDLFLSIARLFGMRSTCPRANVGSVAVIEGRIISTGYNGSPSGEPHCDEQGCDVIAGHCLRTVHAEANVVAWAARAGLSLSGATIYCTHTPCVTCSKLLVNAGIARCVIANYYNNQELNDGPDLMLRLGVTVSGPGIEAPLEVGS